MVLSYVTGFLWEYDQRYIRNVGMSGKALVYENAFYLNTAKKDSMCRGLDAYALGQNVVKENVSRVEYELEEKKGK